MHKSIGFLRSGSEVMVRMGSEVERRLAGSSFRGTSVCKAGNFGRWNRFLDLVKDLEDPLCQHIGQAIHEDRERPGRRRRIQAHFDVLHRLPVGWPTVDARRNYSPDDLEKFRLTPHIQGMRVKRLSPLKAPPSQLVCFAATLEFADGIWMADITSVRPGPDITDILCDPHERSRLVFFEPTHDGRPF